ncbi:hypothetical protein [Streptomyces sp. NPDC058108]|uniref:hypothetical protein n=1 Tax=Streptomyces sp. NPDC058108 TaxID=3346344 RepID=UPI0036E0762E
MTAAREPLVRIAPSTADILRRCYPGQLPAQVLARAVRMLADADGHLAPDGRIKRGVGGRNETRRQA